MTIVDLIYSTRTSLFISKSGVYAYLTILRNGEQQPALVLLFLKAMFGSTSSGCVSDWNIVNLHLKRRMWQLVETKSLITTEIFHISVLTLLNHYNKRELISLFTLQILMFTAFQRYVEIQFLTFRSGEISGKKWSSPSVVIRYLFLNNDAKPNYEP